MLNETIKKKKRNKFNNERKRIREELVLHIIFFD